ncbi:MAG: class I SAM-dependent methyltransferase [Myxococcota bacterium]
MSVQYSPYEKSAAYYDAIYGQKNYETEAAQLLSFIQETLADAQTYLEVGCGTGNYLKHLQHHFACTGADLSPPMLEVAARKLEGIELLTADMRTLALGRRFDVVASLFSSIGYVRTIDELNRTIVAMATHLKPGGLLVVESWITPDQWRPQEQVHSIMIADRPEQKICRMCVSEQRGRFAVMPMHHLIGTLDGASHFVEVHEMLLIEPREYRDALVMAGLEDVRFIADLLPRGAWVGCAPS